MFRWGTRKLYHLLKDEFLKEQLTVGSDKLFLLLRSEGLLIIKKKRYTNTINSKHWQHKHPDLIKGVSVIRPDQIWVADITYVNLEGTFM